MGKIFIGNFEKGENIDLSKKIYVVGEEIPSINAEETIAFKDAILYKYYYKWLSELNNDCCLILNNVLKKRQRNCLEYNCIRYYCKQAGEVIVFSDFPIIESQDDFLILYDMIQTDPFRKEKFENIDTFENVFFNLNISVIKTDITLEEKLVKKYKELKEKTIKEVKKDPDIIPRRLLKFSEKCNSRYGEFDKLTELKTKMNVGVNQLKVDQYFYSELIRKVEEINGIREKISR